MKSKLFSLLSLYKKQPFWPFLRLSSALLFAVLGGILLFSSAIIGGLISVIISVGLDPLRSQLIASLIMTAGAALVGAALGRRKLFALLGASIVFCFAFLFGFIHTQIQPVFDPGNHLEPLNVLMLIRNSFTILALGFLSAFIGSAVGASLSEVLIDPFYQILRFMVLRFVRKGSETPLFSVSETAVSSIPSQQSIRAFVTRRLLAAGAVLAILILAINSSDLFLFSPDVGLHETPKVSADSSILTVGTTMQDKLTSPALGNQQKPFLIYLPPSYNTPEGKNRRYPVLYLLHGTPGKDVDWILGGKATQSADTLIATGQIHELIMVFPDGNGRPGAASEWGNSFDHHQLMENYVATDLVKYVDQHYRTIANAAHRAIGGLSMGGFGAMNIALHHPDVFGTVISLGGYYRAEGSIWGKSVSYRQANSPIYIFPYTPPAWKLHIFLGAATKDQPYYNYTKEFMQMLSRMHIPYSFDLENGYHSWPVWQKQMYNIFIRLQWS